MRASRWAVGCQAAAGCCCSCVVMPPALRPSCLAACPGTQPQHCSPNSLLLISLQAAREQRLLAEACLTHELAELVREANSELEATALAVEAARAKMVSLAADMQTATDEAQAAQRELQGGAAVVPPAERLRQRRRLV